jgi:hypothetical protein
MHTKIDPEFYDLFHHLPTETKFAMLWMLTNRGLNIAGICSVTKPRFEHETGLEWRHFERACQAFGSEIFIIPEKTDGAPKGYAGGIDRVSMEYAGGIDGVSMEYAGGIDGVSAPAVTQRRIWFRNFVRKQVAKDGPSLAKTTVAKALERAIDSEDSPDLHREFLLKYPSLAPLFSSSSEKNHIPLPRGMHGVSIPHAYPVYREESIQRGEYTERREEGVQREIPEPHEPSSPENKKPRAPEDIVPAPEVLQRLGPIFGRQKNARASHAEESLALSLHATEAELALVEAYYRVAMAEPEAFYPKRSLSGLLQDFPSQCDRARAHFASNPFSSPEKKFAADWEPEGWREAVLARFPGALVHEFRTWWDLDRDLREMFPQFPADKKRPASAPAESVRAVNPAAA